MFRKINKINQLKNFKEETKSLKMTWDCCGVCPALANFVVNVCGWLITKLAAGNEGIHVIQNNNCGSGFPNGSVRCPVGNCKAHGFSCQEALDHHYQTKHEKKENDK
jgi:hypothetical protein